MSSPKRRPLPPSDPAALDDLGLSVLPKLMEDSPMGVMVTGLDLRVRWINKAFASISGLPRDVHGGHTASELWGEAGTVTQALAQHVLDTGVPYRESFDAADFQGHHRLIDIEILPLPGPDGTIVGAVACSVEQTSRPALLAAQANIRRSAAEDRARLHAVVTHVPLGFVLVDPNGYVLLYSRATVDYFGEPTTDSEGRLGFSWTADDDRPWARVPVVRTLRTGELVQGELVEARLRSGRRATLLVSSAPVRRRSGELLFAANAFADVTELQDARHSLRASEDRLEATLRRLETVHELTMELAGAVTIDNVAAAMSGYVAGDLGAVQARVALIDGGTAQTLRPVGGVAESAVNPVLVAPGARSEPGPVHRAGQLRHYPDQAAVLDDYPELAGTLDAAAGGTWAVVPMVSSARTVGLGLVGWAGERTLTPEEHADLVTVADQAAVALDRIVLDQQQTKVVETLQVALLPKTLPEIPGVTLSARYRPSGAAGAVGGDWFDAARTERGLVLSVGDVAGHGMPSAAMMAQLRAAARAYVLQGHEPDVVLGLLDEVLATALAGDEVLASAVIADVNLAAGTVRWATAGHPPPLLVHPGGVDILDGASGRLLGLGRTECRAADWAFPPGSTLLLYTDGLVERRNSTVSAGIAELRSRLLDGALTDDPASIDQLIAAMVANPAHNDDDLCVLVAHRSP